MEKPIADKAWCLDCPYLKFSGDISIYCLWLKRELGWYDGPLQDPLCYVFTWACSVMDSTSGKR